MEKNRTGKNRYRNYEKKVEMDRAHPEEACFLYNKAGLVMESPR